MQLLPFHLQIWRNHVSTRKAIVSLEFFFLFCRLIKYLWKWELNRTGLSPLLTADYLNPTTASGILHLLFFHIYLQDEEQPPHFSGILLGSDPVHLPKINILLYVCQHPSQLLPHLKESIYVFWLCFSSHFFCSVALCKGKLGGDEGENALALPK